MDDALAPGEIVEGLKAQVRPAAAEQLSEICPLNPPTALALIMRLAEPPGVTVALWAERLREKSGAADRSRGNKAREYTGCAASSGEIGLVAASSREIKSAWIPRGAATAEHHIPQARIHEHLVRRVGELAEKLPGRVKRVNGAIAKISHQDRARERSEGSRSCHHAPRRVEFAAGSDEGAHEIAVQSKISTCPKPAPGWASCLAASCMA